uniref:NTR domain-containing protein n=2 Tax=Leptobrachium leishanense TaxID=445787 RepID=A0A8C5QM04_9ANUR
MDLACGPGVDYVYKANLVKVEHNDNYDNYIMKIVQIIKQGTDADPLQQERNFISHRNCRDKLEMLRGRDYLIWGVTGDLWLQPSGYSYIIGKETWIEWWPNDRECQNPENEQLCNDYFVVSENLAVVGCPN